MHKEEKEKLVLENTERFVIQLFKEHLPGWALYHDLSHTIDTVQSCIEIGKESGLTEDDLEQLIIAAWFHDVGYIYKVDGHEEKSSEIASDFLKSIDYPTDKIEIVINCILATKVSIIPKNLIESVICDSDLVSLGSIDYFRKNNLLKDETELREGRKIIEVDWLQRSLKFLSEHRYYTDYARLKFGSQLENNILRLREMIGKY